VIFRFTLTPDLLQVLTLKEKLEQREKMIGELNKSWEDRLQETQRLQQVTTQDILSIIPLNLSRTGKRNCIAKHGCGG